MKKHKMLKPGFILLIVTLGLLLFTDKHAYGATFMVNTTADTVDSNPGDGTAADGNGNCSLRAAIMEANALAGADTIEIPAGTYTLTIAGTREDGCKKGDLDILSNLTIIGGGKHQTIIDGNQVDRVFHIIGTRQVIITELKLTNGKTPDGSDENNRNGEPGGGIFNNKGNLTIENSLITHNRTGSGFPGYISNCSSGGSGGGIYNLEGTLTLENCAVLNNRCGDHAGNHPCGGNGGSGGGIYNSGGTLKADHCTIAYNSGGMGGWDSDAGRGGGILNYSGTAEVSHSLIYKNSGGEDSGQGYVIGGDGGGICNYYDGKLTITNSTISGNSTKEGWPNFGGGGICNYHIALIESCTITGNRSYGNGGGICADPYSVHTANLQTTTKIHNTIIANNTFVPSPYIKGNDCSGKIISLGYNLIKDTFGCTIAGGAAGNIYNLDPKLASLADNGGPTRTHELSPNSPAIDTGDPQDFEDTDQRGVLRPKDGNNDGSPLPDMGAFERFTAVVTIASPTAGANVWGTVEIDVDANTQFVDFYIDNTLIHTDDSEPFTCEWDTSAYTNGSHTIKAIGYESDDSFSALDSVKVTVDNAVISLQAERVEESSWIIRRQYGKITFTITNTGSANPVKYVIERSDGNGTFNSIKEVPVSELQGNDYTYNDCYLDKDVSYTYRVAAYDKNGIKVGQTPTAWAAAEGPPGHLGAAHRFEDILQ